MLQHPDSHQEKEKPGCHVPHFKWHFPFLNVCFWNTARESLFFNVTSNPETVQEDKFVDEISLNGRLLGRKLCFANSFWQRHICAQSRLSIVLEKTRSIWPCPHQTSMNRTFEWTRQGDCLQDKTIDQIGLKKEKNYSKGVEVILTDKGKSHSPPHTVWGSSSF